ncbi:MAG: zinc-binding dehydrogenase [Gaiellales bacterium]
MRAVQLEAFGGPEGLRPVEIPDPSPGPGEVVIALETAALNRRDLWIRITPGRCELPAVLGSDGAGRVTALGEGVDGIAVGSEVVINPSVHWGEREDAPGPGWEILGVPRQGTYAERIPVPADLIRPRPAILSWEESAALPLAGLTAWRALVTRGRVTAGMRVLITGAGSGVATFLIQIARAHGARVVVTSSRQEKIERAIDLGAERGVLYTDPEWPDQVGEVDLLVDSSGAPALEQGIRCLRSGGTLVNFGDTARDVARLNVGDLYWRQVNILGTTMGSPREFDALLAHVGTGAWKPVIDSVFPLEQTDRAHARLDDPDRFGKVVLQIG